MKKIKLLLIIGLIIFGVIISCGCTKAESYQDQEFSALVSESGNETSVLLNDILNSAENLDSYGVLIYGAALKVTADNYITECEELKVSPEFEQAQKYYIKALEEISNAGYNYGTAGEYMGKLDYNSAADYINKANENVNSATEYLNLFNESLS